MKPSVFIAVLVVVLGIITAGIILTLPQKKIIEAPENPLEWVEEPKEGIVSIDINDVTDYHARMDIDSEQYFRDDGTPYGFFYKGWFKGEPFKREFAPQDYYAWEQEHINDSIDVRTAKKKEMIKMKITENPKPNDGIIEGIILAREENSNFVFYIFLDEDWKNMYPDTNIIWGEDLSHDRTLHIKDFDFSQEKNGVYVDKIDSDLGWFNSETQNGGILVGNINMEDASNKVIENKTIMLIT